MTHDLTTVDNIQKHLATLAEARDKAIKDAYQTMTAAIMAAHKRYEAEAVPCWKRIGLLELVSGSLVTMPAAVRAEKSPVAQPLRRPARDIVLDILSNGPTKAKEIDEAVVAAGWTLPTSGKAKNDLKKAGLATAEKRVWSLTNAGRELVKASKSPR